MAPNRLLSLYIAQRYHQYLENVLGHLPELNEANGILLRHTALMATNTDLKTKIDEQNELIETLKNRLAQSIEVNSMCS